MNNIQTICSFCNHAIHPVGQKCGVLNDKGKPCKCKGKQGFWSGLVSGLGNAIGESLFGGSNR